MEHTQDKLVSVITYKIVAINNYEGKKATRKCKTCLCHNFPFMNKYILILTCILNNRQNCSQRFAVIEN